MKLLLVLLFIGMMGIANGQSLENHHNFLVAHTSAGNTIAIHSNVELTEMSCSHIDQMNHYKRLWESAECRWKNSFETNGWIIPVLLGSTMLFFFSSLILFFMLQSKKKPEVGT